jgi:hypothetical protein
MTSISLQGSIRTCKVDPGWASRVESDRFLNPELALCPVWTGVDNLGRAVPPFSFYTKNQGCNSASDLVTIENDQRPRYVEYVTLDARGYLNEKYNTDPDKEDVRNAVIQDLRKITGNPGFGFGASIYPGCAYGDGVGMSNYMEKVNNMAAAGMQSNKNMMDAGVAPRNAAHRNAGHNMPSHNMNGGMAAHMNGGMKEKYGGGCGSREYYNGNIMRPQRYN